MLNFLFGEKIDKLTKSIEDAKTGTSFNTLVLYLEKSDLKNIKKKNGWNFDWKSEFKAEDNQVYKLTTETDNTEIQGLISIKDKNDHIFVSLIESAPQNYAKNKKYKGVAGNLFAYACKLSFDKGYKGFVAFTAKTRLIEHYKREFGAEILGGNKMAISTESAKKLVNLYFKQSL